MDGDDHGADTMASDDSGGAVVALRFDAAALADSEALAERARADRLELLRRNLSDDGVDAELLVQALEQLEEHWGIDTEPPPPDAGGGSSRHVRCVGLADALARAARALGVPLDEPMRGDEFDAAFDVHRAMAVEVKAQLERRGLFDEDPSLLARMHNVLNVMQFAMVAVRAAWGIGRVLSDAHLGKEYEDHEQMRSLGVPPFVTQQHGKKEAALVRLLRFAVSAAHARRLRRHGEGLYEQRFSASGASTHAWRRVCSIPDFVERLATRDMHADLWADLNSGHNARMLAERLKVCQDDLLPDLRKDRHVFAFSNGVLDVADASGAPRFHPHDAPSRLPISVVAAKYFDAPLPAEALEGSDWYDVPTPHLQSVLDAQQLPEDACRWVYALLGRVLFGLGERDNWQVAPFFKGLAGTGKSTLVMLMARAYEHEDVGVISSTGERVFGLSGLQGRLLLVAPEVDQHMTMSQTDIQSMISGDPMSVRVKNERAVDVERWSVHLLLAGNKLPPYTDNNGSMSRRIAMVMFDHKVAQKNTRLKDLLLAELPVTLAKVARAYLEMVRVVGSDDVWDHLPPFFHASSRRMVTDMNPLSMFMESDAVELGSDPAHHFCDRRAFFAALSLFCRENNMTQQMPKPDSAFWSTLSADYGVTGGGGSGSARNNRGEQPLSRAAAAAAQRLCGVRLRSSDDGGLGDHEMRDE